MNHTASTFTEFATGLKYQLKTFEKIPIKLWDSPDEGAVQIARYIALCIRQKQQENENLVLGLATGSSPIKIYNELVRLHREEGLSFYNVITFNLDEYYPMKPDANQSYVKFMNEYLFNHIDIKPSNIHIPNGDLPIEYVENFCAEYEKKIESLGGLDIQILGIGRTGHIGFNEPGSWLSSKTRLVKLDHLTRVDAVKDFGKEENVPYRAITMGISTILKAKQIFIMAWGSHKAHIVQQAIEGDITEMIPATYLQNHNNVKFYLDAAAAAELTKVKTPWLAGICNWDDKLIAKAVIWLSLKLKKPLLKLTDEDYINNGLSELIAEYNSTYTLNINIFNKLQHTITGWPGGKPHADDSNRPERANPAKKRVIIFSPHPDDDVISMGGTFMRLVEQGHEVHVAYQVSGNIAVHDVDAWRYAEFIGDFAKAIGVDNPELFKIVQKISKFLDKKDPNESDIKELRILKGIIRREEARSGAIFCGLPEKNIHFLDMPFYETGGVRKNKLGEDDFEIIVNLLNEVKPHQVYAAGDLADPHGTHRVCLDAIFEGFERTRDQKWWKDCYLWLYRGAWHEWPIDEIEMAVPISPAELMRKRKAIFMHQSQKDHPVFPGEDTREFWQRAEDRNKETAHLYNVLGLAEYEAMEAFVRWKF
ncbi:MAG: glucosamine-6-phosphate deaminase [Saprospiraceae bacterium]|jgi:glucosamine-6-phosphate deaminase|nr:glucosamine-6-phosphate deaminase [Saprospiraceae bacterium]MBP6445423.1 glucosamine-6-phosphate deaminase [Saprospiraceae bacterium]